MDKVNIRYQTFDELLSLFECETEDDEFYEHIAFNLVRKNRDSLDALIPTFSNKKLCAVLDAMKAAIDIDIDIMQGCLEHSDPNVVATAVDNLRRLGAGRWLIIGPLIKHPKARVRRAVIRFAYARLGAASKPLLLDCLKDSNASVRAEIFEQLIHIAAAITEQDLEIIKPHLKDKNGSVKVTIDILMKNIKLLS
ncbi:HEAT repeat domain-containing protein [Pseudomonas sp. F1_0610]|uniref:HEAT repeat domain-containing protein n=1 Tax=Pseudomonas sp. F1_0610 TaxID=3114284 RepID=UPI0039C4266E